MFVYGLIKTNNFSVLKCVHTREQNPLQLEDNNDGTLQIYRKATKL